VPKYCGSGIRREIGSTVAPIATDAAPTDSGARWGRAWWGVVPFSDCLWPAERPFL